MPRAARRGIRLPLAGRAARQEPTANDRRLFERLAGERDRPGFNVVDDPVFEEPGGPDLVHHVGGQPVYVQSDIRNDARYESFDRVLLRLTSDNVLMWGDVGEANFLIGRSDLMARDFSRAVFTWDCS